MLLKRNKGVTLTSLTIYVIVAGIVIAMLAFLNMNFFSRMSDLTNQTNVTNEYAKFCSSFIRDVKSSSLVSEYSDSSIKFSNGVSYEIRKLQSTNSNEEKYAIFKGSKKVCESIIPKYVELKDENGEGSGNWKRGPFFDYDHLENTVTVALCFGKPNVDSSFEFNTQQIFKVGY